MPGPAAPVLLQHQKPQAWQGLDPALEAKNMPGPAAPLLLLCKELQARQCLDLAAGAKNMPGPAAPMLLQHHDVFHAPLPPHCTPFPWQSHGMPVHCLPAFHLPLHEFARQQCRELDLRPRSCTGDLQRLYNAQNADEKLGPSNATFAPAYSRTKSTASC